MSTLITTKLKNPSSTSDNVTLNADGSVTFSETLVSNTYVQSTLVSNTYIQSSTYVDDIRSIPQTTSTTITTADAGKHVKVTGGVTINSSTGFSAGDVVTIFNNSASDITITATGITLYSAGTADTGNRTLAQRGLASALCVDANVYVISGAGLT